MTLPTCVGRAGGVAGTAGATIDGDGVAVLPNDLLIAVVHSQGGQPATTPVGGWVEHPSSPISVGTGAGSLNLSVFYKLANGRMDNSSNDAVVLDTGDHIIGGMWVFRGVDNFDPFDASATGTEATADTSLSTTGLTSTVADCLYVGFIGNAIDGLTTEQLSSPANTDLANITLQTPIQAASGSGGGVSVVTGEKATAGSIGATTGTLGANTSKAWLELALKPNQGHPYLVAIQTTPAGSSGDLSVSWPAGHAADDIGILYVETCGGEPVANSPPSGWNSIADSPQATGTGTDGTQLSVFWRRAASGAESAAACGDAGDHGTGGIVVVRGCITTGSPIDDTGGGVNGTPGTTATIPGLTTTVARCLVLAAASRDNDSASQAQFSAWANADLGDGTAAGTAELFEIGTAINNGGGFGVAYGVKGTAGAVGDTTATIATSVVSGYHSLALKPPAAGGGGARFWAWVIA